jgi:hexosaminidase
MLKAHKQMAKNVCFVGGTWCWTGMGVNYRKSLRTSEIALKVCKEEGIREVIMATFGDNGAEGNYAGVLLGMQQYAEHAYSTKVDRNMLAERFHFCTGSYMDYFIKLGGIDDLIELPEGSLWPYNPSKYLLYQDPLMGLFDKNIKGIDISGYYRKLTKELTQIAEYSADITMLFNVHAKASNVLEIKGDLGL